MLKAAGELEQPAIGNSSASAVGAVVDRLRSIEAGEPRANTVDSPRAAASLPAVTPGSPVRLEIIMPRFLILLLCDYLTKENAVLRKLKEEGLKSFDPNVLKALTRTIFACAVILVLLRAFVAPLGLTEFSRVSRKRCNR
jgi:hypothetical protein